MPARQAAAKGGVPMTVPSTTINKACLSGLNAIHLADQMIQAGEADIVVAGGMESMTNAPYLLASGRGGYRYGDGTLHDAILQDGLLCAFENEAHGRRHRALRAPGHAPRAQDEFAAASHERAAHAQKDGRFDDEITPVPIPQRKGDPIVVTTDEGVRVGHHRRSLAGRSRPFDKGGNVTAGNASQLSDGGRGHRRASKAAAERLGATPLAEIVGYGQVAGPDTNLLHQPCRAIQKALDRGGLALGDVDLFELNEAFAAVGLASMADLGISRRGRQRQRRRHRPRPPRRHVRARLALTIAPRAAPARRRPRAPRACAAAAVRATPCSSRRCSRPTRHCWWLLACSLNRLGRSAHVAPPRAVLGSASEDRNGGSGRGQSVRQRGALAVLGAVATVASLLAVAGTPAQAAPLVAPITRVGPDDLTAAIVLDISSDGRWVLAGGFGGVQRIDRLGNAATAPIATPHLDVAITDDGGTMLAVNVDVLGTVTIVRTSPGSGNVNEVLAGSLGAGNWTRTGPIAMSATGRFLAFSAVDNLSFRQTVAVADTQGPSSVTRVDAGLPAALARRQRVAEHQRRRSLRRLHLVERTDGLRQRAWLWRGVGVRPGDRRDRASTRAAGGSSTGVSDLARVSGNGRFVAFVSDANDLVAGTPTRTDRLYVRDLLTDRTLLANGRPSDGPFGARAPTVSDDGRLVAFSGRGTANVGGTTEVDQVLVADLADGSVVQVPLRPNGNAPDSNSATPFLRADGTEVVFASSATDLVDPPTLAGWLLYAARASADHRAPARARRLPRSRFVPMTPTRLLDTRDGTGGWPAGQRPSIATTVTVRVGGVAGVPANASAVVLNVTATDARDQGYVTVYPAGGTRPLASNLNIERRRPDDPEPRRRPPRHQRLGEHLHAVGHAPRRRRARVLRPGPAVGIGSLQGADPGPVARHP